MKTVVAVGKFDAVHIGHQQLLQRAVAIAQDTQQQPCALTFDPLPNEFFAQDDAAYFRLYPTQARIKLLQYYGAKQVFVQAFDADFRNLSAIQFVRDVLYQQYQCSHVIVGANFSFGYQKQGNAQLLERLGKQYDMAVTVVPLATSQQQVISSSVIRAAVLHNEFTQAADLLGRSYCFSGQVRNGSKLGRTLGFPTANIELVHRLPFAGVYAVTVATGNTTHAGVMNCGNRPTVGGTAHITEVHIFDFCDDIYGETITITPHTFIRVEQKFASVDALQLQITKDCQQAKRILS